MSPLVTILKEKGLHYTQLRFDRDLNSWRLNFSWVPFSERASWNFFIGIKSGLLSDIKYEKQESLIDLINFKLN